MRVDLAYMAEYVERTTNTLLVAVMLVGLANTVNQVTDHQTYNLYISPIDTRQF